MPEKPNLIFPMPEFEITRRRCEHVSEDDQLAWQVARPLLDTGVMSACLARIPSYRGDLHCTSVHRFGLVLQGRMVFQVDGNPLPAGPGCLCYAPPGVKLARRGEGPIAWIYFDIHDVPVWNPLKGQGAYVRPYESTDLMYLLLRRILNAYKAQDLESIRIANDDAEMLVNLLQRETSRSRGEATGRIQALARLCRKIRRSPRKDWNRKVMAREMHMTDRHLGRLFHSVYNTSPTQMVIRIRMTRATSLLVETDLTVEAVANAVGYESTFSFSRLFKKHIGVSPKEYRKSQGVREWQG